MTKPLLLDLFCGAGGAAMGYARAGFEVVGVDLAPQPRYPFKSVVWDALDPTGHPIVASWFDKAAAIHASPPCQAHSERTPNRELHLDLIPETRKLLQAAGCRYVIENVEGAPLEPPVVRVCGTVFPGLRVIRHRLFETNWPAIGYPCAKHPLLYMPDRRRPHQGELDQHTAYVSVTGGGNCSKAAAASAMQIDWMTKNEMNEAIPPLYTEFIGFQLRAALLVNA